MYITSIVFQFSFTLLSCVHAHTLLCLSGVFHSETPHNEPQWRLLNNCVSSYNVTDHLNVFNHVHVSLFRLHAHKQNNLRCVYERCFLCEMPLLVTTYSMLNFLFFRLSGKALILGSQWGITSGSQTLSIRIFFNFPR